MQGFKYQSFAQEIIFASGALKNLKQAVERAGWQRLMLCTSPALRANGKAAAVETILGDCLVLVYDRVQPHVQDHQVDEVLALAVQKEVQAIIGLGGGSPVGMVKAVSAAMGKRLATGSPPSTTSSHVPLIAIPTTYAGSEMTAVYGITHSREAPPRKVTVSDPRVVPELVIYDPQLTLDLPPSLTASTGINALAHCIEALYSITRNPLSSAAAADATGHIIKSLPVCYSNGMDLEARSVMFLGAHLAGLALASVKMGLHHGVCHVLGGSFDVPHGFANSIILPHAVRFNAAAAAPQLLPAAAAMGIPTEDHLPGEAIDDMIEQIFDLTQRMNLPQRLRDVGIRENDLQRLSRLTFDNRTVQNNPRPIKDPGEIEALLKEAW